MPITGDSMFKKCISNLSGAEKRLRKIRPLLLRRQTIPLQLLQSQVEEYGFFPSVQDHTPPPGTNGSNHWLVEEQFRS